MIFITGYRTSDCANAVDIAAARYKLQANVECNDLPGVKCWSGGHVISTSHFLQIKIPGWAVPRSPWHREYPRHREQLILSQARCGDVTCRLSRVTCHTMAGSCPRVTLVITSHKPILCLCNEYDCPSNDGRGSTTRSQETNIHIPREAEITSAANRLGKLRQ